METNKNIQDKIDTTLDSVDVINEIKVSPFFKDKVMKRLFAEKEEKQAVWSWFTPQFQLATLVGLVILNIVAFTQLDLNTNDNSLDEFAQAYDLSETEDISLFN